MLGHFEIRRIPHSLHVGGSVLSLGSFVAAVVGCHGRSFLTLGQMSLDGFDVLFNLSRIDLFGIMIGVVLVVSLVVLLFQIVVVFIVTITGNMCRRGDHDMAAPLLLGFGSIK